MKDQTSTLVAAYGLARRTRNLCTTLLAGTFVMAQVTPTFASIDNTAQATGTYNASTANYGSSTQSVPVAAAAPSLTIAKTIDTSLGPNPTVASGPDATHVDAGDKITYTYVVTNNGNVTMNSVVPVDAGPSFNGIAGTGTLGAFSPVSATIAPGASQTFTAVYTLTTLDAYHGADIVNGVTNSAVATGTYGPLNTAYTILAANKATAVTQFTGYPGLTISKVAVLVDKPGGTAAKADVGEVITYTYTITNTGDVPMTNVSPRDLHDTAPGPGALVALGAGGIIGETLSVPGPLGAAASTDTTANNGIWSVLAPGASVTFTWAHTVTQAEFNHG